MIEKPPKRRGRPPGTKNHVPRPSAYAPPLPPPEPPGSEIEEDWAQTQEDQPPPEDQDETTEQSQEEYPPGAPQEWIDRQNQLDQEEADADALPAPETAPNPNAWVSDDPMAQEAMGLMPAEMLPRPEGPMLAGTPLVGREINPNHVPGYGILEVHQPPGSADDRLAASAARSGLRPTSPRTSAPRSKPLPPNQPRTTQTTQTQTRQPIPAQARPQPRPQATNRPPAASPRPSVVAAAPSTPSLPAAAPVGLTRGRVDSPVPPTDPTVQWIKRQRPLKIWREFIAQGGFITWTNWYVSIQQSFDAALRESLRDDEIICELVRSVRRLSHNRYGPSREAMCAVALVGFRILFGAVADTTGDQ